MTLAYERVARKSFGFQHAAPLYTVTDIGKLSLAPDVRGVATDDADIVEEGCLPPRNRHQFQVFAVPRIQEPYGPQACCGLSVSSFSRDPCIISVNYLFDASSVEFDDLAPSVGVGEHLRTGCPAAHGRAVVTGPASSMPCRQSWCLCRGRRSGRCLCIRRRCCRCLSPENSESFLVGNLALLNLQAEVFGEGAEALCW